MEFKAEFKGNELIVKPIIEKKGNDIIVHMPSFPLINKLTKDKEKEIKDKEDGERDIQ